MPLLGHLVGAVEYAYIQTCVSAAEISLPAGPETSGSTRWGNRQERQLSRIQSKQQVQ